MRSLALEERAEGADHDPREEAARRLRAAAAPVAPATLRSAPLRSAWRRVLAARRRSSARRTQVRALRVDRAIAEERVLDAMMARNSGLHVADLAYLFHVHTAPLEVTPDGLAAAFRSARSAAPALAELAPRLAALLSDQLTLWRARWEIPDAVGALADGFALVDRATREVLFVYELESWSA